MVPCFYRFESHPNSNIRRNQKKREKTKNDDLKSKNLAETSSMGGVRGHRWHLKVPKPSGTIHQVLLTQELQRVKLLHLPIHVVQEHVRHTGSLPIPRHHGGGEHGGHSPRSLREIPFRRIDHDKVPLHVVNLVG